MQAAGVGPAQVLDDRELERADYVSYVPTDLAGIGRLDLRVARGAAGRTIEARIDLTGASGLAGRRLIPASAGRRSVPRVKTVERHGGAR